jgi:hypothetical protein
MKTPKQPKKLKVRKGQGEPLKLGTRVIPSAKQYKRKPKYIPLFFMDVQVGFIK